MTNVDSLPRFFDDLNPWDKELTMFTITKLEMKNDPNGNIVYMALKLKRKVATELLTTYLPTILLLLISYITIFFDKELFGDATQVNLTIMLVMTTIFTSKIEELPPTSDTKMIDIWLIFCLLGVPSAFSLIQTAIEYNTEETTDTKMPGTWSSSLVCSEYLVYCPIYGIDTTRWRRALNTHTKPHFIIELQKCQYCRRTMDLCGEFSCFCCLD